MNRNFPSYGSISQHNVAEMGTIDKDRSSGSFKTSVVALIIAIVASLAIGAVLSWYFTRIAYAPQSPRSSASKQDTGPSASELRLPQSAKPLSYDLTIKTYLPGYVDFPKEKNLTFDGQVTINLVALKSVRKFVLNAKNLTIKDNKCSITVNNETAKIKRVLLLPELEKVAFDLEDEVAEGQNVQLKIKYTGLINNNLGGLYQSVYWSEGVQKIAAVTQMEPTDARQMVPCMDEPEYKATWTVSVIHPKGTSAIANGYLQNTTEVNENFLLSVFETTPRMSSYLLALMVSEFDYVKSPGDHAVEFRVWGPKQAKENLQYAAQIGVKCLEYYEKYFNISFPLKKIDMVALPDFSAGAMENWGLITYRENSLMYDKKLWPPTQKRRVADVIAHELAHQWFGNLVTMKWWDDLWLNEGFATYVEYIGANEISDGNFKMQDYMIEKSLSGALSADDQASSHPLSFKIDKAAEVSEAFDTISYDKGGSILRMIKLVMTEEKFNSGIFDYLTKHSYNNAQAADLWAALNDHADIAGPDGTTLDIPHFASQWTTQMGYPYITLQYINQTHAKISQERYKVNPEAHEKEKYANPTFKFKWDVPVWYKVGEAPMKMIWLSRDDDAYIDISDHADEPVVLNVEAKSFFRQNYEDDGWNKIIKQLKDNHTIYSNVTRFAIISDAFAMAVIEKIDYKLLFDLLDYIKNETEYLPLSAFITGMSKIGRYFGTEPEAKYYEEYMSKMMPVSDFKATYQRIADNYLDETQFYENLRELKMFQQNCQAGSVECNMLLKDVFNTDVKTACKKQDRTSDCVEIAAPLRKDVYCTGVKNGDQGVFEKMMQYYKKETVQLEQGNLLSALACSQDPLTLKSLLLTAMDRASNVIRFQDASYVFAYVSYNDIGKEFIFKFFLQRWRAIFENFKSDSSTMTSIITSCTNTIRTKQELDQLIDFRDNAPFASNYHAITLQIENLQNTVEWITKNYGTVTKLLQERI